MRILVIDGHPDPDPKRFCHALAQAYEVGGKRGGHEVKLITLANMDVPMVRTYQAWAHEAIPVSLKESQDAIAWAEHIVVIYPLWLGDVPAYLKAFLEQIGRPGFAIGEKMQGLLSGRSARVIVTMGMPAFVYKWFFFAHSLSSLRRNILYFMGIKPVRETVIGMVEKADHKKWLQKVEALGKAAR